MIPIVDLSIGISDPDDESLEPLVNGMVSFSAGAEGLADMEANAKRKADQFLTDAFRKLREKLPGAAP